MVSLCDKTINCINLMSMKYFMTLPPFAISFADTKRNSNLTLTGAIKLKINQIRFDLMIQCLILSIDILLQR